MNNARIEELKNELIANGGKVTKSDLNNLSSVRNEAKQIAIDTENEDIHSDKSLIDRLEEQAPKVGSALQKVGDSSSVVIRSFFTSIGVIAILFGLLFVEVVRVKFGVMYFEHSEFLALIGAIVLVLLNMVGEFSVNYIEQKYGYTEPVSKKFSIRLWLYNVRYFIGNSDDFEAIEHSPAKKIKDFNHLLTYAILFIALIGSMRTVIDSTEGVWYEAIVSIFTQSDLNLIATWISGFVFTLVSVRGAQIITSVVAKQADEVIAKGFGKSGHELYVSAMENAEILFWEMKLLNLKSKNNKTAVQDAKVYATGKRASVQVLHCEYCTKEFESTKSHAKFCSKECRQNSHNNSK